MFGCGGLVQRKLLNTICPETKYLKRFLIMQLQIVQTAFDSNKGFPLFQQRIVVGIKER